MPKKHSKIILSFTLFALNYALCACDVPKPGTRISHQSCDDTTTSVTISTQGNLDKDDVPVIASEELGIEEELTAIANYSVGQTSKSSSAAASSIDGTIDWGLIKEIAPEKVTALQDFIGKTPLCLTYIQQDIERGICSTHIANYGSDQSSYKRSFKSLVLLCYWMLYTNPATDFFELVELLGIGRQKIAEKQKTFAAEKFGNFRHTHLKTPLINDTYSYYGDRALKILEKKHADCFGFPVKEITITSKPKVDSVNFCTVTLMHESLCKPQVWLSAESAILDEFFTTDKKLNRSSKTLIILNNTWKDALNVDMGPEISEYIGKFHWYWTHICLFERGNASIGEILTEAIWLFHGFLPPLVKSIVDKCTFEPIRLSPDLEAMIPQDIRGLKFYTSSFKLLVESPENPAGIYAKNYHTFFRPESLPTMTASSSSDQSIEIFKGAKELSVKTMQKSSKPTTKKQLVAHSGPLQDLNHHPEIITSKSRK